MPKSKRAESRSKGKRGELDFVHFCKERGVAARRTQQFCGTEGTSDVTLPGLPFAHIEIKRTERFQLYPAIEQAQRDSGSSGKLPFVFHRRNRGDWIMACPGDVGLDLLRAWQDVAEGKE